MTETQLQQAVIELARLLGYRVAHFRPAQTVKGWRTPVEADGKGFPDLVLAGRGRVWFVELKADRGRVSFDQEEWFNALSLGGNPVYVWTPARWSSGQIEQLLKADVDVGGKVEPYARCRCGAELYSRDNETLAAWRREHALAPAHGPMELV